MGRCSQMVKDYHMKYFKFDGISTHFQAKGPGNEEDAEGIIRVLNALRKKKGDLYINCTVAVSYTHLDVYKRQAIGMALAMEP